jgi:hypothetical protein
MEKKKNENRVVQMAKSIGADFKEKSDENGMYIIKDDVSNRFLKLFFQENDQVALRTFQNLCSDKSNQIGQDKDRHSLYKLGKVDIISYEIVPHLPQLMISGKDIIVDDSTTVEQMEQAIKILRDQVTEIYQKLSKTINVIKVLEKGNELAIDTKTNLLEVVNELSNIKNDR